jgi:hypothetical protein
MRDRTLVAIAARGLAVCLAGLLAGALAGCGTATGRTSATASWWGPVSTPAGALSGASTTPSQVNLGNAPRDRSGA